MMLFNGTTIPLPFKYEIFIWGWFSPDWEFNGIKWVFSENNPSCSYCILGFQFDIWKI